jgi:DNA-binding LacI/PurR family transcriptional regulator
MASSFRSPAVGGGGSRRARLVDVAKAAGVSTTTASQALNGHGRVSPQTRERVVAEASRLGYHPSAGARALRLGRTKLVGFSIAPYRYTGAESPTIDAYYGMLINGSVVAAQRRGYCIVMIPPDSPAEILDELPIAAAVIADTERDEPILEMLLALGIPVVCDRRPDDPRIRHTVDNDHAAAVREVFDHFRQQGTRRPGLLSFAADTAFRQACESTYQQWCASHRVRPHVARGHEGAGGQRAAADELIAAGCDAVYALDDDAGFVLLAAAEALGVAVPDDLLVACCADDPAYAVSDPPVTTLGVQPVEMGRRATELLIDLVEGRARRARHVVVPTVLTVRASSSRRS